MKSRKKIGEQREEKCWKFEGKLVEFCKNFNKIWGKQKETREKFQEKLLKLESNFMEKEKIDDEEKV